MRYIATFHPQAWVGDDAVPVDPKGPVNFEVTTEVNAYIEKYGCRPGDNTDDSDELRTADTAPQWIKEWPLTGYFTISEAGGEAPSEQLPQKPRPSRPKLASTVDARESARRETLALLHSALAKSVEAGATRTATQIRMAISSASGGIRSSAKRGVPER